jgi:hypothetical protein
MNNNNINHNLHASEFESRNAFNDAIRGAEPVTLLINAVNGSTEKDIIKGFADQLSCSHRTLQAGAVRVILKGLVKWAQDADVHNAKDLRNEAAVKAVLKLAPLINDSPIPFI